MAELEDILRVRETLDRGDSQDTLAMMSPQKASMPQQTPMPPQQAPMPPQQAPMMQPRTEVKQNLNEVLTATLPDGDSIAAKALESLLNKSGTVVQSVVEMAQQPIMAAQGGGLMQLAAGGEFSGPVPGDGHGMEDNVYMPIKEGEQQVATLAVSPTEYVVDSYTMAALGNGNADAGAKVMDRVVKSVRKKAYGDTEQPNEISGLQALKPMMERV